jgi:hypothetical protein
VERRGEERRVGRGSGGATSAAVAWRREGEREIGS